jgi:hypothetical protein
LLTVAAIALGFLLAASAAFCVLGLGAILRKRRRGTPAVLLGLGLFAAYVLLLGATAALATAGREGATSDTQHKARRLAEHISFLMNISAFGAPVGVLVAVLARRRER